MAFPLQKPVIEEFEKLKIKPVIIGSYWLREGDIRLDASSYKDSAISAQLIIKESRFHVKLLGDSTLTKAIFNLPRFKRIYTNDPSKGWPYLNATEAFMLHPESGEWIAREMAPKMANRHFVKEGNILITCSGAVGRCLLTTKRLEKFFLTHDLLRVIPMLPAGYIYAFLSTWLGQIMMSKDQYGATVTHIEPHHVASIPVPLIPEKEQWGIHKEIISAYQMRDEANKLLDRAEALLYEELCIAPFSERAVEYLGDKANIRAFNVSSKELAERFDGSYHIPIVKTAIKNLKKGRYPLAKLDDIAGKIFIPPRFKRIYVDKEYGVPFLQGSHVPQIKPYDMKYISKSLTKNLEKWIIRRHWVLVTCSGTIGRIAVVTPQQDECAASQHILRIIANKESNPGYIAAFLSSPYGQCQLLSKIYGGVVDEITEQDTEEILIPQPPLNIQKRIGNLLMQAFEKKENANTLEAEAIRKLEHILQNKFL